MLSSDEEKNILKIIDEDEEEIIEFLKMLVRTNSENPPGNEKGVANIIAERLKSFGCKVEMQKVEKDRFNVIGIIEGKTKDKLLFNGHLDTVKVGNPTKWKYNPLGAEIHDGILYGRGAADMKAGLVSMIYAMKALVKNGVQFNRGIMFTGVIDEEVYFKGTKALLKDGKLSDCKMGFVSEPSNLKIAIRQKGGLEFTAKTYGKYAHSGEAFSGVNAIYRMGKVIEALERYNKNLKRRMNLPVLKYPTVNVGVIKGGTGVTFVPDSCEIEFDRQVLPGESVTTARGEVSKVIENIKKKHDIKVELKENQCFKPWEISKDQPVVKNLSEAYYKVFKKKAVYLGLNGYTEAELLANNGIFSVVFGPGDPHTTHSPNERVKIQQVLDATKIYALIGYEFVKVDN